MRIREIEAVGFYVNDLSRVDTSFYQMYELGLPGYEPRAHLLDPVLRCVEYFFPESSCYFLQRTSQLYSENGHRCTLKLLSEGEIHVN